MSDTGQDGLFINVEVSDVDADAGRVAALGAAIEGLAGSQDTVAASSSAAADASKALGAATTASAAAHGEAAGAARGHGEAETFLGEALGRVETATTAAARAFGALGIGAGEASERILGLGEALEGVEAAAGPLLVVMGAVLVAFAALSAAGDFLSEGIESASTMQDAMLHMQTAVENAGGSFGKAKESLEQFMAVQSAATGISKDELAGALQTLVDKGIDVHDSMLLVAVAERVVGATGKDLESVVRALSLAEGGHDAMLLRLDPHLSALIKSHASLNTVVTKLAGDMAGQATAASQSYGGEIKRLHVMTSAWAENIGNMVIPTLIHWVQVIEGTAIAFHRLADDVSSAMRDIGTILNAAGAKIEAFGSLTKDLLNQKTWGHIGNDFSAFSSRISTANVHQAAGWTALGKTTSDVLKTMIANTGQLGKAADDAAVKAGNAQAGALIASGLDNNVAEGDGKAKTRKEKKPKDTAQKDFHEDLDEIKAAFDAHEITFLQAVHSVEQLGSRFKLTAADVREVNAALNEMNSKGLEEAKKQQEAAAKAVEASAVKYIASQQLMAAKDSDRTADAIANIAKYAAAHGANDAKVQEDATRAEQTLVKQYEDGEKEKVAAGAETSAVAVANIDKLVAKYFSSNAAVLASVKAMDAAIVAEGDRVNEKATAAIVKEINDRLGLKTLTVGYADEELQAEIVKWTGIAGAGSTAVKTLETALDDMHKKETTDITELQAAYTDLYAKQKTQAEAMGTQFATLLTGIVTDHKNAFAQITDSFKTMISNMVKQWLTSQISSMFSKSMGFGPGGQGFSAASLGGGKDTGDAEIQKDQAKIAELTQQIQGSSGTTATSTQTSATHLATIAAALGGAAPAAGTTGGGTSLDATAASTEALASSGSGTPLDTIAQNTGALLQAMGGSAGTGGATPGSGNGSIATDLAMAAGGSAGTATTAAVTGGPTSALGGLLGGGGGGAGTSLLGSLAGLLGGGSGSSGGGSDGLGGMMSLFGGGSASRSSGSSSGGGVMGMISKLFGGSSGGGSTPDVSASDFNSGSDWGDLGDTVASWSGDSADISASDFNSGGDWGDASSSGGGGGFLNQIMGMLGGGGKGGSSGAGGMSGGLGGAMMGFGVGTTLNSLLGGNSTWGSVGAGVGSAVGMIGGPLGSLIGGGLGGIIGGLFGNHTPHADEPDLYDTQNYGQIVADLHGTNGANGQNFTESSAVTAQIGNRTEIQAIEETLAQYKTQADAPAWLQSSYAALEAAFGSSASGSGVLNFGKNIGQEWISGATGASSTAQSYTQLGALASAFDSAYAANAANSVPMYSMTRMAPNYGIASVVDQGTYDSVSGQISPNAKATTDAAANAAASAAASAHKTTPTVAERSTTAAVSKAVADAVKTAIATTTQPVHVNVSGSIVGPGSLDDVAAVISTRLSMMRKGTALASSVSRQSRVGDA